MDHRSSFRASGCHGSQLRGRGTGTAGLIGLVTGGRSGERDRSLLSAEAVGAALRRQSLRYARLDPCDGEFADRIRAVDVAFLAIAGQWAEDGKLQGMLDSLGVPYTGSGVLASALAMHKPTAKEVVSAAGVNVLPHIPVPGDGDPERAAQACSKSLGMPVILKPCSEEGSIGMQVLRLRGVAAPTPVLSSPALDHITGRTVACKAEALRRTGSFKFRGAYNAVASLSGTSRQRGVAGASSGNHAQALALAGQLLGVPVTVIVPRDAPAAKVNGARSLGAHIVTYDRYTEDRDEITEGLLPNTDTRSFRRPTTRP